MSNAPAILMGGSFPEVSWLGVGYLLARRQTIGKLPIQVQHLRQFNLALTYTAYHGVTEYHAQVS